MKASFLQYELVRLQMTSLTLNERLIFDVKKHLDLKSAIHKISATRKTQKNAETRNIS